MFHKIKTIKILFEITQSQFPKFNQNLARISLILFSQKFPKFLSAVSFIVFEKYQAIIGGEF